MNLEEKRCPVCKKLLFKGKFKGVVEIKCRNCKQISKFEEDTPSLNLN